MKLISGIILVLTSASLVSAASISSSSSSHTSARFYNGTCTSKNIGIRKEWRNMTKREKKAYLEAEKCLIALPAQTDIDGATTRFSDLQALHRQFTNFTVNGEYVQDVIHNVGQFLPWHRLFMHAHENMMRTECNYTGPMTWWDEASDADSGHWFRSNMWAKDAFGGNGQGPDKCVEDGAFAGLIEKIGPQLTDTTYCLDRDWDDSWAQWCDTKAVKACIKFNKYYDFFNCVGAVPHGIHYAGHGSVGGVMSDINSSPGEPTFFLHHSYIDRVWWQWQQVNPSTRLADMSGNAWNYTYFAEYNVAYPEKLAVNTSLDFVLYMGDIVPSAKIADVMNAQGGLLCYDYDY